MTNNNNNNLLKEPLLDHHDDLNESLQRQEQQHHQQQQPPRTDGDEDATAPSTTTTTTTSVSFSSVGNTQLYSPSFSHAQYPLPQQLPTTTGQQSINEQEEEEGELNAILHQGNVINESYLHLSTFQWMLLLSAVIHSCSFHVLTKFQILHHVQFWRFGQRSYHYHLIWVDFVRGCICLALEYCECLQQQQQHRQQQIEQRIGRNHHREGHHHHAAPQAPLYTNNNCHQAALDALRTSLSLNFVQHTMDALKPSVLVVLTHFQSYALAQCLNHLRLYWTELTFHGTALGIAALSMQWRLLYKYTSEQVCCLCGMILGIILASPMDSNGFVPNQPNLLLGMFWVMASIASVSFAFVYLEYMLKQDLALVRAQPPSASLWIRGMQFSLAAGLVNVIAYFMDPPTATADLVAADDDNDYPPWNSFWGLVCKWMFTPVMALGVLITLANVKYVTSVHDKLAMMVAYSLSLMVDDAFLGITNHPLNLRLYFGVSLMGVCVYLFGMHNNNDNINTNINNNNNGPNATSAFGLAGRTSATLAHSSSHHRPNVAYEPLATTVTSATNNNTTATATMHFPYTEGAVQLHHCYPNHNHHHHPQQQPEQEQNMQGIGILESNESHPQTMPKEGGEGVDMLPSSLSPNTIQSNHNHSVTTHFP